MAQTKACSRCREQKPSEQFPPSKQTPDGLFRYCRLCKQIAQRESHSRRRSAQNAKARARYRADPEPYKARALARYARDPAAVKRQAAEWAQGNQTRRLEIRRQSARRLYALDPERRREAWRRRHAAIRRGCAVYPFTTEQLAAKVAYWGGRCWMCRGPFESLDHVKPLAKQGPHMLANLRPACTACNTRKRDQWPLTAA